MGLPTQQRLNDHLVRWDREIKAFEVAVNEYGLKKAELEYERAVLMEKARHEDEKISQASAERLADADEGCYTLHRAFRTAEGAVEAIKARLRWCAAVADALRSEVSTERAEAQLYSGPGTP